MNRKDFSTLALLIFLILPGCDRDDPGREQERERHDTTAQTEEKKEANDSGPNEWRLSAFDSLSRVGSGTTHAELVERYGTENLSEGETHLGEGEMAPATILFPDDSTRRLEIVWSDPQNRGGVERITLSGDRSMWWVAPGITLGTSLDSLVAMNGKPITFYGFDWDYGGTIADWNGGNLAGLDSPERRVLIRLGYDDSFYERLTEEERRTIAGDQEIGSDLPLFSNAPVSVREILLLKGPEEMQTVEAGNRR